MKNLVFTLFLFMPCLYASAQVGINTEDPKGILHIDSKSDTNGSNNTSDDVVIDGTGNIGIGRINPQTKLDINGNIVIKDGTEGNGKVLVSDADGKGSWEKIGESGKTSLWTMENTDGIIFNTSVFLYGNSPSTVDPLNEVGLTPYGNGAVIVPQGLYFIIVEHDLHNVSEYGSFYIYSTTEGKYIYTIYYKEKLSGASFIYNFEQDSDLSFVASYRNIDVSGFDRYKFSSTVAHPFTTQIRFIRLR